jgi:hypothetical protein
MKPNKTYKAEWLLQLLNEFRSEADMWIDHCRHIAMTVDQKNAKNLKRLAAVIITMNSNTISDILSDIVTACRDAAEELDADGGKE